MLTWIKEIVNLSSKLLPTQYLFRKKLDYYIYEFHITSIIKELDKLFDISTYCSLADIHKASPFRGLIGELFRSNEFYPSLKDIAIAINISIKGYCNEKETYNGEIIDLSYSFIEKLRQRIMDDPRLSELFSQLGKDVKKICSDFNRNDIEETLKNKKEMFTYYFKSFENKNINYQITISHQAAEKTWIEWEPEDSITLDIDRANIREGFFLLGFDYSNNGKSLTYATSINGYEYFDGIDNDKKNINRAIWLK